MFASLFVALAVASPANGADGFAFLILPTEQAEADLLSPLIRRAPSSPRPAAPIDLAECETEGFSDHRNRCVRAQLPDRTIAFLVNLEMVSNVTGSVVHRRDRLICIGPRGVGRIELNAQLGPSNIDRIADDLPACITAALTVEADWGGGLRDGRLWRFPLVENRLAANGAQARGRAAERAIIRFTDTHTTHRNDGRCAVAGRIIYVEAGTRLRAGDRFEVEAPCRWEGPDGISRMFTQGGLIPGWTGRVAVSYRDGVVEYIEPL